MSHPKHWLKYETTVPAAEAEFEGKAREYNVTVSPNWLVRWNDFKAKLVPGDELWYYEHFPEPLTGGAGYCIVRGGEPAASITTMRS